MQSPAEAPVPDYVGKDAKLPLGVKLAYGAPNFAGAGMAIPIAIHMSIFYSDTVLVPLGYIAGAAALARAFDAITDPLMGWITDRTHTRWGRRRPWMFLGAPLCALAFIALFSPPVDFTWQQAAGWFTATYLLYFLFHTMYSIPHYGLGPELTSDYKERSSLFGWMEGFALLGTMVAAISPAVLIPILGASCVAGEAPNPRPAYTAIALGLGGALTLLYVWQCVRIKERPDFYGRKPNPIVPGFRRVMRNRPFRVLLSVYLAGSITAAIPGLLMPFYTKYVLQPENPDAWIGIFLLAYFGSGFVMLPFWIWLVRRWGKKEVYLFTFPVGIIASLSLFFLGKGDLVPCFFILVWAGSVFGVRLFLGPSMQADVIDYDELYSGKRREAQYGSLWALITKFTVIPSASIPLAILSSVGFVPNAVQTDSVQLWLRGIYSFGPASTALIAFAIAWYFPIREDVHRKIVDGIAAHKRGEAALDPLTGKLVPPPNDRGVDEDTGWFLDHFAPRELRRYLERGVGTLTASTLRGMALSAALLGALTWIVSLTIDLDAARGRATWADVIRVLGVVGAGFSLTAVLYHALRYAAARRMVTAAPERTVVEAHLEVTRSYEPHDEVSEPAPIAAAGG